MTQARGRSLHLNLSPPLQGTEEVAGLGVNLLVDAGQKLQACPCQPAETVLLLMRGRLTCSCLMLFGLLPY